MTEQEQYNRFLFLLEKTSALSDEEINELVSLWAIPTHTMVLPHIVGMFHARLALEQIRSIRTFDRASSNLIVTTNKLTRWILCLTILASILAIANVVASGWPYLTSWICHGFGSLGCH